MSNGENGGGAPSNQTGGTGGDNSNQNQNANAGGNPERVIPYSEHKKELDKVLEDMHKFKNELKQTQGKLSELETERLKGAQDFKTLWEKSKAEKEEVVAERDTLKQAIFHTQKFDAVKTAALQAGILNEALSDLELLKLGDDVVVETTSHGRFLVHGAKEMVESLKKTKPHWFKKPGAPNVNTGGGATSNDTPEELTALYMEELRLKNQKKYKELLPTYVKQAVARKKQ
jgi:seryl-tRNA synthetase